MRAASAGLTAYLLSRPACFSADLFTIELLDGTTLYLTSFDQPITAGGQVYSNNGMTIERSSWEVKNTTDVPTMQIQLYSTGTDFPGELNFKQLAHQGILDGGIITLERAFMPTPNNTALGTVLLFGGRVSTVTVTATGVSIAVKGFNVLLQQYMPKNIYSLGCIHNLYDVNCKAVKASFTFDGEVAAGGNKIFIPWVTAPANPGNYSLGSIVFTSGNAEGQVRTVNSATSAGLQLAYPLYALPAAGDTFAVSQGCAKTQANCAAQFSNLQNFRGFPFIPPEETAYS